MATVAKAMACPESGLEVRDRMWLKITIANAFIGMSGTLHFVHSYSFTRVSKMQIFYLRNEERLICSQVLMLLTGCSTTLKGFLIAEKPVNTPATC